MIIVSLIFFETNVVTPTLPHDNGHLLKVQSMADKHCLFALGKTIITRPFLPLGSPVSLNVVQVVVFEDTLINNFLARESLCFAWTVLLLPIWTTPLINPLPQARGTNLVLTFRTPRSFGPFFERMGEPLGLIVITRTRGPRPPNFLVILSKALFALILVIKTLIPLLALPYTLRVAACVRVVGPVGPLNRFRTMVFGAWLCNLLVPLTVFPTFPVFLASINRVFTVPNRPRCLLSTALGTASTVPQFPMSVIYVNFMLAPLSAGLTTIVLGPKTFPVLVLLTTVRVTWLPISFLGPKHLSPVTTRVPVLRPPSRCDSLNKGAFLTSLANLPPTSVTTPLPSGPRPHNVKTGEDAYGGNISPRAHPTAPLFEQPITPAWNQ